MFLYGLSYIEVLGKNTTAIMFLWAFKDIVGYEKVKRLGLITSRFPGSVLLLVHVIWCKALWNFAGPVKESVVPCQETNGHWKAWCQSINQRLCMVLFSPGWKMMQQYSLYLDNGPSLQKNVRPQVYSKWTSIFYFPNLGLWRSSNKKWKGNCMPN